jgi:hypothetical protein
VKSKKKKEGNFVEYQYKVTSFDSQITTSDMRNGKAGAKISAQLEVLLQEYARNGWELQGQYEFTVDVKVGCIERLFGNKDTSFRLHQLVFRKPM